MEIAFSISSNSDRYLSHDWNNLMRRENTKNRLPIDWNKHIPYEHLYIWESSTLVNRTATVKHRKNDIQFEKFVYYECVCVYVLCIVLLRMFHLSQKFLSFHLCCELCSAWLSCIFNPRPYLLITLCLIVNYKQDFTTHASLKAPERKRMKMKSMKYKTHTHTQSNYPCNCRPD